MDATPRRGTAYYLDDRDFDDLRVDAIRRGSSVSAITTALLRMWLAADDETRTKILEGGN